MSPTSTFSMADRISRDDLLATLASIGVVLPPSTKIPDAELSKKLLSALDAAQDLHDLVPAEKLSTGLDTREYPFWPPEEDMAEGTTREPMRTLALTEQMRRLQYKHGVTSTDKEDTFPELRQIVMGFGHKVPEGHKDFCLLDEKRGWGVFVRIAHVRKVEERPLFVLLYKEIFSTEEGPFEENSAELFEDTESGDVIAVHTTELERKVILKLFRHNAKRLSLDYLPINHTEARVLGLQVSFILPLVPPHMKILGKLSENAGCEICGKPKISRCVQCLTVAYCGPECQKADWKNHKSTCKSLAGGMWKVVHFSDLPMILTGRDKDMVSLFATFDQAEKIKRSAGNLNSPTDWDFQPLKYVPENIHTGRTFLVKIQISYTSEQETLLVYDRQRTFNIFLHRVHDPVIHAQLKKLIGAPLKMYRWAKRVSDLELEICFDRTPSPTPVW